MNPIDLKLKLLTGRQINVEGFGDIYPLTLKDIVDMDYSKYSESLNTILLDKKTLLDESLLKEFENISDLELLIYLADENLKEMIESAYKSIFKCSDAFVDKENLCIFLKEHEENEDDFKIVNKDNFEQIIKILKLQNCIEGFSENDEKEEDSEDVKKFKKRLKELEKEREKAKKRRDGNNDDESVDLYDIISSLAGKSFNTNEIQILDLTIYQIYDKFKRLQAIDRYDIDIKSMLAGAKNVDIKHWTSKV